MPDLFQSLHGKDLGHLRIVAELWGMSLEQTEPRLAARELAAALLDRRLVEEIVADLPDPARAALDDLLQNGGALPWALFTRRYGMVREMGPGRRDRERPYANPASAAETLWYRAFIGRVFQDTPQGPEEFAFIPKDLLALLPAPREPKASLLGRPASQAERKHPLPAGDRVLDHACTLLAELRLGQPAQGNYPLIHADHPPMNAEVSGAEIRFDPRRSAESIPGSALRGLLEAAGLLDEAGLPLPEPTRAFLEAPRGEALAQLARAWLHSDQFNELRLLPGLRAEGEWQNDPLRARQAVLDFISSVTAPGAAQGSAAESRQANAQEDDRPGLENRPYWSLTAFVDAVRQQHPDFQRPGGDYDSWHLRDEAGGGFLRGFEHWDQVEGALLRFLICGPLHWLGALDLAAPEPGAPPAAFRSSAWAPSLLSGSAPPGLESEIGQIVTRSDARLSLPRRLPRAVRYQVARFCQAEGEKDGSYRYRLTPASLERARQQGLRAAHLIALLRKHSASVPPSLTRALERWEEHGVEARIEQVLVLRLRSPELLQALRGSRAARFLGEPLSSTAVIVKPGAWEKVIAALAELGYLGEGLEKRIETNT
jgi:hypothetical protein